MKNNPAHPMNAQLIRPLIIRMVAAVLLFTALPAAVFAADKQPDLSALPDEELRVLLLGDSLSSGYGLQGEGWVAQANQAFAAAGKKIVIINDSISGDTTAGGVARIEKSIARTKPDWVLLELGGNDGLRGLPPKIIAANLRKMVEIARSAGAKTMILGIRIPPNYGRSYTEKFEQTFVDVSEETGSPLLPFFIDGVGGDPALNQSDMIHPNDKAQPLIRDRVLVFLESVLSL